MKGQDYSKIAFWKIPHIFKFSFTVNTFFFWKEIFKPHIFDGLFNLVAFWIIFNTFQILYLYFIKYNIFWIDCRDYLRKLDKNYGINKYNFYIFLYFLFIIFCLFVFVISLMFPLLFLLDFIKNLFIYC